MIGYLSSDERETLMKLEENSKPRCMRKSEKNILNKAMKIGPEIKIARAPPYW